MTLNPQVNFLILFDRKRRSKRDLPWIDDLIRVLHINIILGLMWEYIFMYWYIYFFKIPYTYIEIFVLIKTTKTYISWIICDMEFKVVLDLFLKHMHHLWIYTYFRLIYWYHHNQLQFITISTQNVYYNHNNVPC